ncbi:MAG: hypothetical protein WC777_04155 [Candidatus Gracilibacteria bacterium]|jgi:hypothetical protein
MKTALLSVFLITLLLISGCGSFEDNYQADADLTRIADFNYYVEALKKYHEETGSYPLMKEYATTPVYSIIIEGETPEWVLQSGADVLYIEDDELLKELQKTLGDDFELHYDPQNYAETSRPVFYIYSLSSIGAGITVHLYEEIPGSVKVDEHYYKLEEFLPFN